MSDRPSLEARASISPARLVPLALAAVYVIWGSSQLAFRIALETLPPFLLGALRFLVAGGILYAVLRARGTPAPTRAEWRSSVKLGALFLVIGNGAIGIAARHVPSSLVVITGATMPLMVTLVSGLRAQRTSATEVCGLALGALGIAVLGAFGGLLGFGPLVLLLALSPLSWALGTVWSRTLPLPRGAMATAAQLLTGGVGMAVLSIVAGERAPNALSLRSVCALGYLTIFCSLIAFSAYGFLIRHASPALATSHAYVNPILSILLGARLGGESLSRPLIVAGGLLIAGVATVSVTQVKARAASTSRDAAEGATERLSIVG